MSSPSESDRRIPQALSWSDLYRRVQISERRGRRMQVSLRQLLETVRCQGEYGQDLARSHTGLGRDVQHLQQRLEGLSKLAHGNGDRGFNTRLAVLESEIHDLKEQLEAQSREHWKLLASLATGLLSLVSSLVLWLVKGGV